MQTVKTKAAMLDGIPLGGVIAKGDTEGNNLPYFRFIELQGYPGLAERFYDLYGARPSRIYPVYLRGLAPDECISVFMEQHQLYEAGGKLLRRCDGEHIVKSLIPETGEWTTERAPCLKDAPDGCQCQRRGRLHFMLPALHDASGYFVRYMATTGAWSDVTSILAYLREVYVQYVELGTHNLNTIPFELYREPVQLEFPDAETGELIPRIVHNIALRVHGTPNGSGAQVPEIGQSRRERFDELFRMYIPGETFGAFTSAMGVATPDAYLAAYSDIEVCRHITEWVINSELPVSAPSLVCQPHGKSWRYDILCGFATVSVFTRTVFRNAGYSVDEWRGSGNRVQLSPPALLTLKKTGTGRLTVRNVQPINAEMRRRGLMQ